MRALIVVALVAGSARADTKLSLPNVRALVAQRSFTEAYAHLGDIDPVNRDAEWVDVAAGASAGLLGTAPAAAAIAWIDRIDREYPQVLTSAKYTAPRAELGVKSLETCFAEQDDRCVALATRFVDGDPALALRVAKLVWRGSGVRAIELFGRAGKACKDDDLQRAVVAGLALPPDHALVAPARTLMEACWPQLEGAIVDAFAKAASGGYLQRNTCGALAARKLLSPLQAKICSRR